MRLSTFGNSTILIEKENMSASSAFLLYGWIQMQMNANGVPP
jgi:hypothetical protein